MNNKALFEALRSLEQEKGISMDAMITQISKAIVRITTVAMMMLKSLWYLKRIALMLS